MSNSELPPLEIKPTDNPGPKKVRFLIVIVASIAVGLIILAGFFLTAKFLKDRDLALNLAAGKENIPKKRNLKEDREAKNYTKEEIEKLKKEGKLPATMRQAMPPNQPVPPQDDPVQRSLRTINEINRINEMNQRLLEQQQRMQRQK